MTKGRIILLLHGRVLFAGVSRTSRTRRPMCSSRWSRRNRAIRRRLLAEGRQALCLAADTLFVGGRFLRGCARGIISRRDNRTEKISTPLATAEPYQQEGLRGCSRCRSTGPRLWSSRSTRAMNFTAIRSRRSPRNSPKLYVHARSSSGGRRGTYYKDGKWLMFRNQFLCTSDLYRQPCHRAASGRGGRLKPPCRPTSGLRLCRRYDRVEDRLVHRCRAACHYLEERSHADAFQPRLRSLLLKESGTYGMEGQQSDADGGRGRPDQRGLRLFEAGGRPRRRARDLPDRLPHMAPGIPLCRGGLALWSMKRTPTRTGGFGYK